MAVVDGPLTEPQLREVLHYDPESGNFTWRVGVGKARVGAQAGHLTDSGYRLISWAGHHYRAHRLVWLYMTGRWPAAFVDHINLRRDDNRWDNLREATKSQNNANKRPTSSHGFKGATYNKRQHRWLAQIKVNGHQHYLGYYDTPQEAHAAYMNAARQHFGEFARAA